MSIMIYKSFFFLTQKWASIALRLKDDFLKQYLSSFFHYFMFASSKHIANEHVKQVYRSFSPYSTPQNGLSAETVHKMSTQQLCMPLFGEFLYAKSSHFNRNPRDLKFHMYDFASFQATAWLESEVCA